MLSPRTSTEIINLVGMLLVSFQYTERTLVSPPYNAKASINQILLVNLKTLIWQLMLQVQLANEDLIFTAVSEIFICMLIPPSSIGSSSKLFRQSNNCMVCYTQQLFTFTPKRWLVASFHLMVYHPSSGAGSSCWRWIVPIFST